MAARIFMRAGLGGDCRHRVVRRPVLERRGRNRVQHAVGNADAGDFHLSAERAPRQQDMRRFFAEERDRQVSADDAACSLALAHHARGIAMQAARHVDGDDRRVRFVDGPGERGVRTFQRTRKPRAEQRIDDERLRGCRLEVADGFRRTVPAPRHLARVALQSLSVQGREHGDGPAALLQQPGDDIAVAAIVAGAAQHRRRALRRAAADRIGDRTSGVLHQRQRRHARGDGQPVGLAHLGDGENGGEVTHRALTLARGAAGARAAIQ